MNGKSQPETSVVSSSHQKKKKKTVVITRNTKWLLLNLQKKIRLYYAKFLYIAWIFHNTEIVSVCFHDCGLS